MRRSDWVGLTKGYKSNVIKPYRGAVQLCAQSGRDQIDIIRVAQARQRAEIAGGDSSSNTLTGGY